MIAEVAVATLLARPFSGPPSNRQCRTAITEAVARESAAKIPAHCWRMGPLTLGMKRAEVEERIGSPVATANVVPHTLYGAALYAFPANPNRPGSVAVRLVELRYERARLVAIDTAPGARIASTPCGGRLHTRTDISVDVGANAGPLLRFGGVAVGDPTTALSAKFGRIPDANASQDWLNYLPVPISFDVDPDRQRVTGIAIATNDDALTSSVAPQLLLRRDPATCRLVSVNYRLRDS